MQLLKTKTTKAMNEKDIRDVLADVLAASNAYYSIKNGRGVWSGVPHYYEGYYAAVRQRDRIANHAEVDKYPEDLFAKRAPNETKEEAEYIKANYKNTTHPIFVDYLSVIGRALADGNWTLKINTDSEFPEYLETGIEYHRSLETFIKEIILPLKAKDPNGVIAVTVPPLPTVEVNGELVTDDRDRFRPQPRYFPCDAVVAWEGGEYAMLESHEKTYVTYGTSRIKAGRVFYVYTKDMIWKIEQYGLFRDHTFEVMPIMRHDLGYVPAIKLKGVPSILPDNRIYYTSRFYYSVDPLDKVLTNSNYLQCSVANCMFPFRVMVGDVCDFIDEVGAACSGGYVPVIKDGMQDGRKVCPSCHGSGLKQRVSPMGTYLLKPKEGNAEGDTSFAKPVEYISPSTDAGKFVQELIEKDTELARSILHIHTSNTEVKGGENRTATGDAIDLKAMYAFVRPESEQIFDIYEFLIKTFADIRGEEVEVELARPRTFDFRTDADMLADIQSAREGGAPDVVQHALIYQFIQNRYYADTEGAQVFSLIVAADRLLTLSGDMITARKAQGLVQPWEVVLHDSAVQLINELIAADANFLNTDFDAQIAALVAKAKERAPAQVGTAAERIANILG